MSTPNEKTVDCDDEAEMTWSFTVILFPWRGLSYMCVSLGTRAFVVITCACNGIQRQLLKYRISLSEI